MPYRFQPVRVDLSDWGDGCYAICLHPKLQPNGAYKSQQAAAVAAATAADPELLQKLADDPASITPSEMLRLAPALNSNMDARDDMVCALVLEWHVLDCYTAEPLFAPRTAPNPRAVLARAPGEVVQAIYNRLMEASRDQNPT